MCPKQNYLVPIFNHTQPAQKLYPALLISSYDTFQTAVFELSEEPDALQTILVVSLIALDVQNTLSDFHLATFYPTVFSSSPPVKDNGEKSFFQLFDT